jgi:hypothetical protein
MAGHPSGLRSNPYHETMSYDDLAAVSSLVNDSQQQERLREVTNNLARHTARGGLSAHWWLPLDAVSYAGSPMSSDDDVLHLAELSAAPLDPIEETDSEGRRGIFIESLGSLKHR